ncbi:S-adenosyl-L-methionine-dependent methyltransferase, partial [Gorgonomyces haynaldii]
ADLENEHVHKVYDEIAKHFSDTRHKPWPVVDQFIASQPNDALGADVGCGNGKYMVGNPTRILGSDRSQKLIEICGERGLEAMVCDGLNLAYRSSVFDFCLSIAVIHHFSSKERRIEAIRELLRIVKPKGQILIFVWAMEQETTRRKFEQQDVMVDWKVPARYEKEQVYQRYYHVFVKGELDELCKAAGAKILRSGYDRDNHFVVIEK